MLDLLKLIMLWLYKRIAVFLGNALSGNTILGILGVKCNPKMMPHSK